MRFTIQEHAAKRAGLHWDLRLEIPADPSRAMASWAIPKHALPKKGQRFLAVPTEDHPLSYQDFNGELKDGYGAGDVKLIANDEYELESRKGRQWTFRLSSYGRYKIVPFKDNALIIGLGE